MQVSLKNIARTASLAVLAGALAVAAVKPGEAAERVRWQMTMGFPSTLPALADTAPWVADMVGQMSSGNITLQVFEPGKLASGTEVFDVVSQGKVDSGYVWAGYEQGKLPASALFGAVPFGMEPPQFMAWMLEHGGQEMMEELYAPHNIVPLFCGTISPEAAGWFRFPLESLDQVKGLKIRFAGIGGKVMEKMGASVTLLPAGELFQALEKGVLDATEFSLPSVDEKLGFYKVVKYYHMPGWHQPSTNQYLYVNKAKWDSLEDHQKAIIRGACIAGVAKSLARAEGLQGASLKAFTEEHGVTAVKLPEPILRELQEITAAVMAEEAGKDADFNKVWESQSTFMAENQPWHDFAYLPRDFKNAAE